METRVNERCRISDVVEPCCFDQNIAVQVVEMPSKALCFRRHGSNVTQTAVVTCEQCSGRDGRWMVEEAGGVKNTIVWCPGA
jgi:hypothetical protein